MKIPLEIQYTCKSTCTCTLYTHVYVDIYIYYNLHSMILYYSACTKNNHQNHYMFDRKSRTSTFQHEKEFRVPCQYPEFGIIPVFYRGEVEIILPSKTLYLFYFRWTKKTSTVKWRCFVLQNFGQIGKGLLRCIWPPIWRRFRRNSQAAIRERCAFDVGKNCVSKGIWAPINTHYIRCIWGWLLRVSVI